VNRTGVADHAANAALPAQRGATVASAEAWLLTSATTPGMLRVRPLPHEATASYTHRLAGTYQLTLPQLLDGAGITLNGNGTPPAAELRLNDAACSNLAALARIPPAHLRRALPGLDRPDTARDDGPATGHWLPLDTSQQPVRACTLCTLHRSQCATGTAWVLPAPHRLVCPRHHQATPDPRLLSVIRTQATPELAAAHRNHQRLLRHPRASTAWQTAHAITTRWHDQQHHLTHRWHNRLTRLCATNPHLTTTGSASPALLARDLIIYPETVTVARTLATQPNRQHHDTNDALTHIARQLDLTHLTPATHDPLRTYLTHTRR
jgi:hypothetical protein